MLDGIYLIIFAAIACWLFVAASLVLAEIFKGLVGTLAELMGNEESHDRWHDD